MSFLEKIRKKSWLIISVIGLALLALLIDPKSLVNFFGKDPNVIGEVNNQKISLQNYLQFQELIEGSQKNNPNKLPKSLIEAEIWKALVNEKITFEQVQKAGIELSRKKEEEIQSQLMLMLGGENQKKISKEQEAILNFQKKLMTSGMRSAEYFEMIQRGISTSSIENIMIQKEKNSKAQINYVLIPFKEIEEKALLDPKNKELFGVDDNEINKYLKGHKDKFEQKEEMRDLNLVSFKAEVSKEDELKIEKEVNDLAREFKSTKDHAIFSSAHSDFPTYDNSRYLLENQLPEYLKGFLKKAALGDVYGPKKENSVYLMLKLTDKKMISPSTKSSHILVSYKGVEGLSVKRSKEEAKKLASEYLEAIKKNNQEFENLVKKSDDPSSTQNKGDLGWVDYQSGQLVKEFQDFIDTSQKGHIGLVETPYGYHIIRIDDKKPLQKGYQLSLILKNIKPSKETMENLAAQAKDFAQQNNSGNLNAFVNNAREKNYKIIIASDLKASNPLIPKLGSAIDHEIISWAFLQETKKNKVKLFHANQDGSYVVAFLSDIKPKGLPSIDESIRSRVSPILKREKIFDYFKNQTKHPKELKLLGKIKTSRVDFANTNLIEEGFEPEVVGLSSILDLAKTHGPIKGRKGVYFVEVLNREVKESSDKERLVQEKLYNQNEYSALAEKVLKDKAIIKDYRKNKL